ncbi:hypothetical protein [Streptomyces scabiei]|uniref:hypothetical protein n=1 Tax=Streptomyces scabiei TaxID=1930 RepID=UPI0029A369DB|nr:hypothetical protein [Streptomyces scabiei]MDX3519110.1 hypothetical protein [Streptomyces scabiei]
MDLEKRHPARPPVEASAEPSVARPAAPQETPEGCLTAAIRIPVRIVVLVLVVPVRMVWDLLVVAGRFLGDTVLRPLGRASLWAAKAVLVRPWVALWRYAVVPLAQGCAWLGYRLLVVPAVWVYRYALTPVGHAIAWVYRWTLVPLGRGVAWLAGAVGAGVVAAAVALLTGLAWLARYLLVVPAGWLYRYALTPVGHALAWVGRGALWLVRMIFTGLWLGIYWTARVLLVLPALAVWRWALVPVGRLLAVVGRELRDAVVHAWRVAGHLSRAVGRFLAGLLRWLLVEPALWLYRTVLTPAGHVVRDVVWKPAAAAARVSGRIARQAWTTARESARQARAAVRSALLGRPAEPRPVHRREPGAAGARTLGRSTTALTKD